MLWCGQLRFCNDAIELVYIAEKQYNMQIVRNVLTSQVCNMHVKSYHGLILASSSLKTYSVPCLMYVNELNLDNLLQLLLLPVDESRYESRDGAITDNGPFWRECSVLHLLFLSISFLMFCEHVLNMLSFVSTFL